MPIYSNLFNCLIIDCLLVILPIDTTLNIFFQIKLSYFVSTPNIMIVERLYHKSGKQLSCYN